jgi:toxin secretion/phage lysis holin
MEKYKIVLSVILGFVSAFYHRYGLIMILVACAIAMDFITGLIKAKVSGVRLDSGIAWVGFWKKMALLAALFFGFYLDAFIPAVADAIGITIQTNLPFGLIVGCYIAINESISICENLYECDANIIPKWIANLLRVAKNQVDQKGDQDERRK